ncbi:hypothetical protein CLOBOL_06858 [Enterocloster bolteae ATCC BAA-613]|uniref:Uncharacterized protein n=1 Tax=Enterocloster bolteae (strain ATCC BAA-613 / DSM 15670 / CCUG 46953 / JCM 12243 / WAL 16351) TaxID=411902 RepID=A8S493_ENTBW|nr:hypothetical protein CLOBOL_06858 [Enterocloster bolteae ATCC BAA-613]
MAENVLGPCLMVWLILMDCQFMDIFHPFTSENDRKKNR